MSNNVKLDAFSRPTKELIWVIFEQNVRLSQTINGIYQTNIDALQNRLVFDNNLTVARNDFTNYNVIPGPIGNPATITSVDPNSSLFRGASSYMVIQ